MADVNSFALSVNFLDRPGPISVILRGQPNVLNEGASMRMARLTRLVFTACPRASVILVEYTHSACSTPHRYHPGSYILHEKGQIPKHDQIVLAQCLRRAATLKA